tara:strand:+ start:182 stop:604 length:423 start_codon:yes stop_codon:yes gene_type:complete
VPAYPLSFSAKSIDVDPTAPKWEEGVAGLAVSIPPEFDGPGDGRSPEDFLGMAMVNCFIATFRVYAGLSKVAYNRLEVGVNYTIEPGDNKLPIVTRAHFEVSLQGAENPARAERLLAKVSKSCIVLNSLSAEKTFDLRAA